MAEMILIRGVPGSGKSTLAMTYAERGFKHFEADQYFVQEDGKYYWNISQLADAHKDCFERTEDAIVSGFDVVISNTFTRIWEMQGYIDLAEKYNMKLKVIRCMNKFKNIHNVPDDKVQQMLDRFEFYKGEYLHDSTK